MVKIVEIEEKMENLEKLNTLIIIRKVMCN